MPRSSRARLQADLASAAEKGIPNVHDIRKLDDGFVFTFRHPQLQSPHQVEIRVVPQDETFLVYTDGDVPTVLARELEETMMNAFGMKVGTMLNDLSRRLQAALEGSQVDNKDTVMTDADDSDFDAGEAESEDDLDFEYGDNDDDMFGISSGYNIPATTLGTPSTTLSRTRQDLRVLREAGFKFGILCGLNPVADQIIVSTSVRVDKLCLSNETREAWNLESSDFIVLLIRYNNGHYTTFEDAVGRPAAQSNIEFRLRKCSRYKPTLHQAISAFSSQAVKKASTAAILNSQDLDDLGDPDCSLLGIGSSIDLFMDKDFIPMLKLRHRHGISWDSAKKSLSVLEKAHSSGDFLPPASSFPPAGLEGKDDEDFNKLPAFLAKDHLDKDGLSLPLIATQFALRYFVRCTDYCMICHEKIADNFEALKPYVCSKSLCLFQYMNLGFGPSVDHEIINQPHVIDLLISFCYASLAPSPRLMKPRLREFPTGLSLQVPNIRKKLNTTGSDSNSQPAEVTIPDAVLRDAVKVLFDWDTSTVSVDSSSDIQELREGQWVVIHTPYGVAVPPHAVLHYARIEYKSRLTLTLRVASRHTMPLIENTDVNYMKTATGLKPTEGHLVLCNQNLDDLDDSDKAFSMSILLSALPSVAEMRAYLISNPSRQLTTWERIVPASMGLLRWIVASNRSYIVQVDECPIDGESSDKKIVSRENERISGVEGWLQFRFAQGSPEKEALFQQALKQVQKPQRTLLAWHGSSLGNWHSIIRQGLNYDATENGRAYGHGVYFSREFGTSRGYSGMDSVYSGSSNPLSASWPQSALKVTAAMGLTELINLPEQFQSSRPYFVVQHCHWIQCRYIFVRHCSSPPESYAVPERGTQPHWSKRTEPEFAQDPKFVTTGPGGKQLFIPQIAIPSALQLEKRPPILSLKHDAQGHLGDSDDEDNEDVEFLLSDESTEMTPGMDSRSTSPKPGALGSFPPTPTQQEPQSDFRPGTLDLSSLPQLNPPSYATEQAQRTIGKEIKKLQKIQSSTPLHELGWYINFEKITNMFQWIVEFHSFDTDLPLAQDMKEAGVTSIVLEVRFGRDFPMSPPFIRIIRPRFLPFMNGGGGHVTSGGAMCMELLTTSGWSPVNSLESVLLQVRMAICSVDPKPARLESTLHGRRSLKNDYGVFEAFDAFTRAANVHNWLIPQDHHEMINTT